MQIKNLMIDMGQTFVFEALTNERAINRFGNQKFFSEKFYILLKTLNQKECSKKFLGIGFN